MATPTGSALMERLVSLCKRRGFIFQSSEIYGGINGFWDYGPLGVELKNNLRDAWWDVMVRNPPPGPDGERDRDRRARLLDHQPSEGVGGERPRRRASPIPMQTCRQCKKLFRADHVGGAARRERVGDRRCSRPCDAGAVPGTYVPRRGGAEALGRDARARSSRRGSPIVREPDADRRRSAEDEHDVAVAAGRSSSSPGAEP